MVRVKHQRSWFFLKQHTSRIFKSEAPHNCFLCNQQFMRSCGSKMFFLLLWDGENWSSRWKAPIGAWLFRRIGSAWPLIDWEFRKIPCSSAQCQSPFNIWACPKIGYPKIHMVFIIGVFPLKWPFCGRYTPLMGENRTIPLIGLFRNQPTRAVPKIPPAPSGAEMNEPRKASAWCCKASGVFLQWCDGTDVMGISWGPMMSLSRARMAQKSTCRFFSAEVRTSECWSKGPPSQLSKGTLRDF